MVATMAASTIAQYLAALPADRRAALSAVRKLAPRFRASLLADLSNPTITVSSPRPRRVSRRTARRLRSSPRQPVDSSRCDDGCSVPEKSCLIVTYGGDGDPAPLQTRS